MSLHQLQGFAQGTTWQIQYVARDSSGIRASVDTIFRQVDNSVSAYTPSSVVSRINAGVDDVEVDSVFSTLFQESQAISQMTDGAFDITVAPLIRAYGFGPGPTMEMNDSVVYRLRPCIGFDKVALVNARMVRDTPCVQLDFNAIAQGYTVDRISSLLNRLGIKNFLVEVGGEIRAQGKKPDDSIWTVGIETPDTSMMMQRSYSAVLTLKDRAMATSGNYRRFYEEEGRYFAHIVDPRTGESARSSLLSATVFADNCSTADAFATAFTVMGLEPSKAFLNEHPELDLDVVFIYREGENYKMFHSPRLKASLRRN